MTEEQIQNLSYNERAALIIKQQAEIENLKTSYQRLTEQFQLLADKVIKKDIEIERLKGLIKMLFMAYRDTDTAEEKWLKFKTENNL